MTIGPRISKKREDKNSVLESEKKKFLMQEMNLLIFLEKEFFRIFIRKCI